MKFSACLMVVLALCVAGFTACGPTEKPSKPPTEEEKKKLDDEMRSIIEKNKKAKR